MAATVKVRGNSPKVRNSNRTKGYWVGLAKSREHKARYLPDRSSRIGINFPELGHVGSAAYRRLRRG